MHPLRCGREQCERDPSSKRGGKPNDEGVPRLLRDDHAHTIRKSGEKACESHAQRKE